MQQTASWLHRILALAIDWVVSIPVVMLVIGPVGWAEDPYSGFYTLGVFLVEASVLTAFVGGSFGQLMTRLRVVRAEDGGHLDLGRAALRSLLIALVIPPLVARSDGRGLHDLAVGSVTVRLGDLLGSRQ